jgi:hypothetical protein
MCAALLSLTACNSEKRSPTTEPARTAATAKNTTSTPTTTAAAASPTAEEQRTMVGKVVKKPWSKSLESWHAGGADYFVLQPDTGKAIILRPSHKVSLNDLETAVGKKVRVGGTDVPYEPYKPASPTEQYPTGIDGKPIPRGGGLRAMTLEVLD